MTKDTGGPAFPFEAGYAGLSPSGMTLRDWFAGQALVGISREIDGRVDRAEYYYQMADAMIAERNKR